MSSGAFEVDSRLQSPPLFSVEPPESDAVIWWRGLRLAEPYLLISSWTTRAPQIWRRSGTLRPVLAACCKRLVLSCAVFFFKSIVSPDKDEELGAELKWKNEVFGPFFFLYGFN